MRRGKPWAAAAGTTHSHFVTTGLGLVACALFVTAGCTALVSLEGLTSGSDPGDAAASIDGGSGAADARSDAPGTSTATCPAGLRGPALVDVGGFCIDATEVTHKQYSEFLDAKGSDTAGQPDVCVWNKSYAPAMPLATIGPPENPITWIDWCDAYAYCTWAGKRLCGKIGGGPAPFDGYSDPNSSQWMAACSRRGAVTYPYGNTYDKGACNTDSTGPHIPPGSKASCMGGYPGLFDMSGNVEEWEDSCTPSANGVRQDDTCHYRGGATDDTTPITSCAGTGKALARSFASESKGIRCCYP